MKSANGRVIRLALETAAKPRPAPLDARSGRLGGARNETRVQIPLKQKDDSVIKPA